MRREHEPKDKERGGAQRQETEQESVPIWQKTRPRGNPEREQSDVDRAREKWEAVLGR